MNKKKKQKILVISIVAVLLICVIMIFIKSNEKNYFDIKCDKKVDKQGNITCVIKGVSAFEVSAISSNITVDNGATISSVSVDSKLWQGDGYNGDLDLYTDVNKKGEFNVAEVVIKPNDAKKINIKMSESDFFDADFLEQEIENVTYEVKVK